MTPGDERFARSMADLSSRLRERMAQQPPTDPITALKNRQAALKAFDRDRRQKLYVIAGGLGCVVAAGALAWGIVMFAQPDQAATAMPNQAATAAPVTPPAATPSPPPAATPSPPPAKLAAATPPARTQAPPPTAPVTVEATTVPAPDPQRVDDKPTTQTASAAEAPKVPDPASTNAKPVAPQLPRNEIAEAQRLLAAFGFSPGPVDGSAGPRTLDAVSRYQQKRGLTQTGVLDGDLLQQLRRDPSPKTVMVAQRPPNSTYSPPPYGPSRQSSAGVFEPVRMAGQQITAWLNSVFR